MTFHDFPVFCMVVNPRGHFNSFLVIHTQVEVSEDFSADHLVPKFKTFFRICYKESSNEN